MSNTYSINITCSNCDYAGSVDIPKGTPVSSSIKCPNCECDTARKNPEKVPLTYRHPKIIPMSPDIWSVKTNRNEWDIPYISDPERPKPTVTLSCEDAHKLQSEPTPPPVSTPFDDISILG